MSAATDEAVRALIAWRQVDRTAEPDDPQAWAALLRLRDMADRIEREAAR